MGAKTNEYQKLVTIIHRLFAPKNANITPSAMVDPVYGGNKREIDILVQYEEDSRSVAVAVEAKCLKRAIDVMLIDQYVGKYCQYVIPWVNKVIIVGKSFSKDAKKYAEFVNFELHTLKSIEDATVKAIFKSNPAQNDEFAKDTGEKTDGYPWSYGYHLVDNQGRRLPDDFKDSRISARGRKYDLGIPLADWIQKNLDRRLRIKAGEALSRIPKGDKGHIIVEYTLKECDVKLNGVVVKSARLICDFGEQITMPDLEAKKYELREKSDVVRNIIVEQGEGAHSTTSVTYEESADYPKSIYIDFDPAFTKKSARIIRIRL